MAEELLYVGIDDPVEVRRALLLSSKSVLESLKRSERFDELVSSEGRFILELKHNMDELSVLSKKLKGHLPAKVIQDISVPKKPVDNIKVVSKLSKPKLSKAKSKLDLLEDELERIEKRLESLG